jgi:hypothetical protein
MLMEKLAAGGYGAEIGGPAAIKSRYGHFEHIFHL